MNVARGMLWWCGEGCCCWSDERFVGEGDAEKEIPEALVRLVMRVFVEAKTRHS